MKTIVIVGAGPRGLAMALRASLYNYQIIIIDEDPISTWRAPNMLENIQMRSPISFDLTTLCPDLNNYSLSTFLNLSTKYTSQEEVENCDILCSRYDFINYLKFIYLELAKRKNVKFIFKKAYSISANYINCFNEKVTYDYLIICTGINNHKIEYPAYLQNQPLINLKQILNKQYSSKYFNVIGSGQQSAEIVEYLARQNLYVNWIQKHTPTIKQYPVPSIKEWGIKSALGPYYSTLSKSNDKNNYLQEVKKAGPTITPYIALKLEDLNYSIIKPTTTEYLNNVAHNVLALGFKQEIELLPFDFEIMKDCQAVNFPNIDKNFRSSSNNNIYFSGLLALRFDGPRQGSIISSALTANNIMCSILEN